MTPREDRLVTLAKGLLTPFIFQNEKHLDGRVGLCLATRDLENPSGRINVFDLGSIPADKIADKRTFAEEKAHRLLHGHIGHLSSFESEYKHNNKYGGGVRVNDTLIVAASGFPACLDQDFVILLGLLSYEMTLGQALEVRRRTVHKYPAAIFGR